ncbi:MAG: hypothetical protein ACXAEX_17215 [Promethearchaeota archaeon]|jgi:hypothetical protein
MSDVKAIDISGHNVEINEEVIAEFKSTLHGKILIGGALNHIDPDETVFDKRDAKYMLGIEANWISPTEDETNIQWARDTWDELHQLSKGGLYLNFARFEEEREALHKGILWR